jgi:glycerol kinase
LSDLGDIERNWDLDREFQPQLATDERQRLVRRWAKGVQRAMAWEDEE